METVETSATGETRSINELNLQLAVGILNRAGIPFWLDQGTLLGVVRDANLLPWDKDIDLSVWEEEFPRILGLKSEFESAGFYFEPHEEGDCLFLSRDDGYFVDIARYRRLDNVAQRFIGKPKVKPWQRRLKKILQLLPAWVHIRVRHMSRIVLRGEMISMQVPLQMFSSFRELDFMGLKLRIPQDSEAYLQYKYGDWRTPVKVWDYSKQDGGVVNN
jgi:phosphorylcholine metabolism protein LicD